jgi:gamma-glutamyltranspeptidase/glutathione hydrolase
MVATVFCVGVIGMYHSGIGGGGFMLVRNSSHTGQNSSYEFIDFRESMPVSRNLYKNGDMHRVVQGHIKDLLLQHAQQ